MTTEVSHPDPIAERILDAAHARFEDDGVSATTMRAVAETAGVGRATLYRYHPGKDALVAAVVMRETRALFALVDDEVGGSDDVPTLLERGLLAALSHLRHHPLLQRVLREEPASILPLLTVQGAPLMTAAVEFATPYAERAVKTEHLPHTDPRAVAEWAARVLLSLVLTPSVVADLDDPEQARWFVKQLLPEQGGPP